ncbi:unnamed protein product [Gordionus sp. m RMFG-2023]
MVAGLPPSGSSPPTMKSFGSLYKQPKCQASFKNSKPPTQGAPESVRTPELTAERVLRRKKDKKKKQSRDSKLDGSDDHSDLKYFHEGVDLERVKVNVGKVKAKCDISAIFGDNERNVNLNQKDHKSSSLLNSNLDLKVGGHSLLAARLEYYAFLEDEREGLFWRQHNYNVDFGPCLSPLVEVVEPSIKNFRSLFRNNYLEQQSFAWQNFQEYRSKNCISNSDCLLSSKALNEEEIPDVLTEEASKRILPDSVGIPDNPVGTSDHLHLEHNHPSTTNPDSRIISLNANIRMPSKPILSTPSSKSKVMASGHNKKRVTFADDVGQSLVSIRVMTEDSECPPESISARVSRDDPTNVPTSIRSVSDQMSRMSLNSPSVNPYQVINVGNFPGSTYPATSPHVVPLQSSSISTTATNSTRTVSTMWMPQFHSPNSDYAKFCLKLETDLLCLESVFITSTTSYHTRTTSTSSPSISKPISCLKGNVKVNSGHNTAIDSRMVFVRVTFDVWNTWIDLPCSYVPTPLASHGSDQRLSKFDNFEFRIPLPSISIPHDVSESSGQQEKKVMEFAICLKYPNSEHWDNNYGNNYRVSLMSGADLTHQSVSSRLDTISRSRRGSLPSEMRNDRDGDTYFAVWDHVDTEKPFW